MFTDAFQAIQALPDHQTTDCLPKTGQAIRAVLADKKRRPGKIGLAEGVGSTKATAAQLEKKPLGFKSVDDLRCTGAEDSVSAILRAPVTPRSYHAPMSPPPAPRKPRGRRL